MADIFISCTGSNHDWAFWIAEEREADGHAPHGHQWEIPSNRVFRQSRFHSRGQSKRSERRDCSGNDRRMMPDV
jgi:hypothetical protein